MGLLICYHCCSFCGQIHYIVYYANQLVMIKMTFVRVIYPTLIAGQIRPHMPHISLRSHMKYTSLASIWWNIIELGEYH